MRKILIVLGTALLSISSLSNIARGQGKAEAAEVIAKVRQAASALSKTGDLAQFDKKQGTWVWKDSYIFVINCDKQVIAAHPITPKLIGQTMASIRDTKGDTPFPHPAQYCESARTPSGVWIQYSWPKPGEKTGSRKLSYSLGAKGTPYVVGAGIYDSKDTIARLTKLTSKK